MTDTVEKDDGQPLPIDALSAFLGEFVSAFISAGGQTVRVDRSTRRIGLAFGLGVELMLLSRHAAITVTSLRDKTEYRTVVVPFQAISPNFTRTFGLNRLSWEFFDRWLDAVGASSPARGKLGPDMASFMGIQVPKEALGGNGARNSRGDFECLQAAFHEILLRPRLNEWALCLMTGVASAAFCRLFGGDWLAMTIVLFACQAAFLLRRFLVAGHGVDVRLAVLAASFTASVLSAAASRVIPSATPEIAVASSILFLIPGIPLLSAVNDILHGHTLMGISRGVNAAILTLCIAFGLAATLMVTGFNVL